MRLLTLDAALARCSAAVVADGPAGDGPSGDSAVLAERRVEGGRSQAQLPDMVQAVLAESGADPATLDAVAVTVGPGSFTGLRSALALAHGLALAIGRPVVAVSVAEALAAMLPVDLGLPVWTAIDSKRGRVFLDCGAGMQAVPLDALPQPPGRVALVGDAAAALAALLTARGNDVLLTEACLPEPRGIALAALARLAGKLPPLLAQPLYIDPPEAKLPAGGLRPAPLGLGDA